VPPKAAGPLSATGGHRFRHAQGPAWPPWPGAQSQPAQAEDVSAAHNLLGDPEKRARFDRGEIDPAGMERPQPRYYRDFAEAGGDGPHPYASGAARERHGIDLVGPQRRNTAWQSKEDGAFEATDFTVDWERQVVRCPEGKASTSWKVYSRPGRARGRPLVHARFHPWDCRACPARPRCTRSASAGRLVSLLPQREHEALAAARARERTAEYRGRYAQRQGIEATMPQAVRAFGLRQARYRGLVKTGLQHVATAAAINLDRLLAAWLAERPLAPTRTSRFAAITV
jgi:hypothetical protein